MLPGHWLLELLFRRHTHSNLLGSGAHIPGRLQAGMILGWKGNYSAVPAGFSGFNLNGHSVMCSGGGYTDHTVYGADSVNVDHGHTTSSHAVGGAGSHTHGATVGLPDVGFQVSGTGFCCQAFGSHTHPSVTSGDPGNHGHVVSGSALSAGGSFTNIPVTKYIPFMVKT